MVSADTDFGELLTRQGATLPSLILFRQGNRTPEHQTTTLVGNLTEVADDLDAGAIVVFTNASLDGPAEGPAGWPRSVAEIARRLAGIEAQTTTGGQEVTIGGPNDASVERHACLARFVGGDH